MVWAYRAMMDGSPEFQKFVKEYYGRCLSLAEEIRKESGLPFGTGQIFDKIASPLIFLDQEWVKAEAAAKAAKGT